MSSAVQVSEGNRDWQGRELREKCDSGCDGEQTQAHENPVVIAAAALGAW